MRVLCLFLRYGENAYGEAFAGLLEWYRTNVRSAEAVFWIIDNKLPPGSDHIDGEGYHVFAGDNSLWEFSAWDKVLKSRAAQVAQFEAVHFVTSAYNTLYTRYLDHFSEPQLHYLISQPVCLGHIDSYDEPVQICRWPSQHWIRTCFFFLSRSSLRRLEGLVSFNDKARFFDEHGEFRQGSISPNYVKYINEWLGGKAQQGVTWHSRVTGAEHFQQKAMTILNEHMLAVRLRRSGLRLVDFCWLRHALGSGSDGVSPVPEPWDRQVEVRRRILAGEIPLC